MSAIPRIVVSAPSSGHGKTAIAVGLLAAFAARGLRAAGFKIGSDYVDAAYLGLAAGRPGRNLDPRLVGAARLGPLFAHGAAGADVAVIEGTMGLYDGLAGRTDAESTAGVSGLLGAPVVLVVDAAAMGQSVAALVHGFRAYDEVMRLGGVILNRVASDRHEQVLREALGDLGVPVLGVLRRRALSGLGQHGAPLPPRAEGVGPVAHGSIEALRAVRRLGEVMARSLELERLLALARSAPPLACGAWSPARDESTPPGPAGPGGRPPRIAVAGGPRLTFGYAETADLLVAAGAEVVTVDPIRDEQLPDGTDALVVGGGLPEAYAEDLSANGGLRRAVAELARAGRPVVAEGTGLVWLCREFAGRPMCGVLDAVAHVSDLTVLGYREAAAVTGSVLMPAGTRAIGHKLHRTLVSPRSGQQPAWTWANGPAEGFVLRGVHASYLCLHWAGTPEIAARFVAVARATGGPARSPAVPTAVLAAGGAASGGDAETAVLAAGGAASGGDDETAVLAAGGAASGGDDETAVLPAAEARPVNAAPAAAEQSSPEAATPPPAAVPPAAVPPAAVPPAVPAASPAEPVAEPAAGAETGTTADPEAGTKTGGGKAEGTGSDTGAPVV